MVMRLALLLLAQTPALPPGVEARSVALGSQLACPSLSQSTFCDDPSVVEPYVDPMGPLDQVAFVGRKLGTTTCSCGLNRGFRFVWRITVRPVDEVAREVGAGIAARALQRLRKTDAILDQ